MFKHASFVVIAALAAGLTLQAKAAEPQSVEVEGTEFKVTLTDGQVLRSAELAGATLTITTTAGPLRLRIDGVERDPDAKTQPVWLHSFSTEAADGSRHNLCNAGPDGRRQGFPLAFRPRGDGAMEPAEPGVFELVCTAGARGKCVRFGYLPWTSERCARSTMLAYAWCGPITAARVRG